MKEKNTILSEKPKKRKGRALFGEEPLSFSSVLRHPVSNFLVGFVLALILFLGFSPITSIVSANAQGLSLTQEEQREIDDSIDTLEKSFFLMLRDYVDDVEIKTLFEGAMKGLYESVEDPYTEYLTEKELEGLNNTAHGDFGGVGLYISSIVAEEDEPDNGRKPYVEVISAIAGTPAYRAGVHAGDYIYSVEDVSAKGKNASEIAQLLKGKPGTKVNVTFLRGDDIQYSVEIRREKIEIPTIEDAILDDSKVGYLRVIQFTPYTAERFKESLLKLAKEAPDGLIIDLRGNPGGLLGSVLDILDYFIPPGELLVTTRGKEESNEEKFFAKKRPLVKETPPIAVLIDKGTASASEILTGGLRDYDMATVWGETSFGKGLVQRVSAINDSLVKLTIARYYLPKGELINKIGIEPDYEILNPELSERDLEDYKIIIEKNLVGQFIEENESPSEKVIVQFIQNLRDEYKVQLEDRYLNILIRNEVNRRLENPPVYDLKYDETLRSAYEFLKEGSQKKS